MNYQKIYTFDLANGPGIRVSLFVSGCSIRCKGCFNKEAWCFQSGKFFGRKEKKAIKKILKDNKYDGLSILGGEPFDQDKKGMRELIRLSKFAQRHKKTVWIWTGHLFEELTSKEQKKLLKYCNVLVDGPFEEVLKNTNIPFRGSCNQRIIEICNQKKNMI